MLDERQLCLHQVTVLHKWSTREFIEGSVRHGIGAVALWRDKLAQCGIGEAARMLSDQGLAVTSLVSAGLVTSPVAIEAVRAVDEVRRAIDDAAAVGADSLMFVAGGLDPRDKDLPGTRERVVHWLAQLAPHARSVGVRIALEPLHPMVCGTRSVLSSLKIANDWCDTLAAEDVFGIAVDTYAVWWDPDLATEIARAGARICAFHINDWLADTQDLRFDRGMMGDGIIDIPRIRALVEAAGYTGYREVEIFSQRNWWQREPDEVIRVVKERYQTSV
jgi:sugar phosphate isomerase/epimerase